VLQGGFDSRLVVMVVDGDRYTNLSQSQTEGVSDATITAGDNSHFILQYHGA
jgi:hypothetical protein